MNEEKEYEVIKNLVDHGGNKERAALTLDCTRRSIDRHIVGYKAHGKEYFIHGNRGRKPAHTLDDEKAQDVVDFYRNKYGDANFAHFKDMLHTREGINISETSVRNLLAANDILSPKANRKTRREYKAKLKRKLATAASKKEQALIQSKIIDADEAHPRRPRCANFGEMIQMDASLHPWFGSGKSTLHIAIDDATGIVTGARFEAQETLKGYYHVFEQILTAYGIPYMFYTDRRSIFEYRKGGSQDTADDSFTQFSYACKQFGVHIETTVIPQAKGRVERLIQTMQSRLPVELRLEGVTTLEQANEFLPGFIAQYNARFALPHNCIPSVFEAQPSREEIDMTLAVIAERTVDSGHSIRYDNGYYRTLNKRGVPVHFRSGTKGLVVRTFSGSLYFSANDGVYALEEVPQHERESRNFGSKPTQTVPRKQYIPPSTHPWKHASFMAYVRKQAHRLLSTA